MVPVVLLHPLERENEAVRGDRQIGLLDPLVELLLGTERRVQLQPLEEGDERLDEPFLAALQEGEDLARQIGVDRTVLVGQDRSEEHTSELQSLMRISYAVFCLKKKKHKHNKNSTNINRQS